MSKKQKNTVATYGLMFLGAILLLSGCAAPGSNPNTKMLSHAGKKSSTAGAAQTEGLKLSYSLAAERLTLREPVILNFTARNDSGQATSLDLGYNRKGNFLFTIKGPDGKTHQLRQLRKGGISLIGEVAMQPGQVYTQTMLLNEWFEFAEPGAYEISARLAAPQSNGNGATAAGDAPEFQARLIVGPLDKGKLKQTCSALLKRITDASSYSEAAEAALALGYVNDSLAIPFLEKALSSNKMVAPILISGLERIDGQEAERVLAAAAEEGQDEDLREQAKAAVERLRKRKGV